jgi:hypothetical protein
VVEEREKLALDQELDLYTYSKIIWLSCETIHVMSYMLKVSTIEKIGRGAYTIAGALNMKS